MLAAGLVLAAPCGGGRVARIVPPPAPSPTDSGRSPAAPDPHPPLGGRDPDGRPVGGRALLRRGLVVPEGAPPLPRELTARAWMLTDLTTGRVLAARDPHGRYQPASIQKLLTSVTLLPRLPGGREVVVSRRAALTEGSRAGLVPNGRYTVDDLFRGLLLVSGNDCAEALAQAAGGRARTVRLMNGTALRLGAYDTYVQTPSGLDGWQQLTSAYDMTLVLRAALAQPRFAAYDTVLRSRLPRQPGVGRVVLWNQNVDFLTGVRGALVAKTGYTDAAQHTFAGAIRRHGHAYGVVLLRAQRWPIDQWQQATRLVRWGASLPPGTRAVGTLVAPSVARPATAGGTRSSARNGSPARSRATELSVAPPAASSIGSVPAWLLLLLGLALVAGGTTLTVRAGGSHHRRGSGRPRA